MQEAPGYNMSYLIQEAKRRWLKTAEVFFILQNCVEQQITHQVPKMPTSGSLYLYNNKELKKFREDGHAWKRESHMPLKVKNVNALTCSYAKLKNESEFLQRRIYVMSDQMARNHIVLAHYMIRDGISESISAPQLPSSSSSSFSRSPNSFAQNIVEVKRNAGPQSELTSLSSSTFSPCLNSYAHSLPESSFVNANQFCVGGGINEAQDQLKTISDFLLNDDDVNDSDAHHLLNEGNEVQDASRAYDLAGQALKGADNLNFQQFPDNSLHQNSQLPGSIKYWSDMANTGTFSDIEFHVDDTPSSSSLIPKDVKSLRYSTYSPERNAFGVNSDLRSSSFGQALNKVTDVHDASRAYDLADQALKGTDNLNFQQFPDSSLHQNSQLPGSSEYWSSMDNAGTFSYIGFHVDDTPSWKDVESLRHSTYTPERNACWVNSDLCSSSFGQALPGISLGDTTLLTVAQKPKFIIRALTPDWCYTSEEAKIYIIGSFPSRPPEYGCVFGDTEVPVQILQEGVLCCSALPKLQGKVPVFLTSGNRREPCSEVKEFEFRDKPSVHTQDKSKKSSEELLLSIFVQMLLSDRWPKEIDLLEKLDPVDGILDGTSLPTQQELLKEKFDVWISSRLDQTNSLPNEYHRVLHVIAALGFEWGLQPILNFGVDVNVEDRRGRTALQWATQFGRKDMIDSLIAAGAVTFPSSQDPKGKKVPAWQHLLLKHVVIWDSLNIILEVALTSHLSSLTLEESEMSRGFPVVEAERAVNNLSLGSASVNEDQVSLGNSLPAIRNATQAGARIQSAFHFS